MIQQGTVKITGAGCYIPENITLTQEILSYLDTQGRFGISENFLSKKAGIISHRSEKDLKPSQMAANASRKALEQADISATDIDLIIFCGITRDREEPATAHYVQRELGTKAAICFDVVNACHGVMNGISIANDLIKSGSIKKALVCTAEKPSEYRPAVMDEMLKQNVTRETFQEWIAQFTLGDAGGALVLEKSENSEVGFQSLWFYSDSDKADLCSYFRTEQGVGGATYMREIMNEFIAVHNTQIENTYKTTGWNRLSIDHLVIHQTGLSPVLGHAQLAGINPEKMLHTFPWLGNIASATIPVVLSLTNFNKNEKMLFLTGGSGLTIGQSGAVCAYRNMDNNPSLNNDIIENLARYKSLERLAG